LCPVLLSISKYILLSSRVDNDLKVDILEVVKISAAYGSTPTDSNWGFFLKS
jgi:hypothetical protein